MMTLHKPIELESSKETIRIRFINDVHAGAINCNEGKFIRDCKEIADTPHHYWIGVGDYGEFINRKDKRYDESQIAPWLAGVDSLITRQSEWLCDYLMPIKDKCLGLAAGNHELTYVKYTGCDPLSPLIADIPDSNKPIFVGKLGFCVLHIRWSGKTRIRVRVMFDHGYGGGRLEGGHALTLGRIFKSFECDVAVMAHRHVAYDLHVPCIAPTVNVTGNGVVRIAKQACFAGAYKETYLDGIEKGYETMAGYPPNLAVGYTLVIEPDIMNVRMVKDAVNVLQ